MKLSELIENLICLEGLAKEKKRENGAPTSKAFKDYTVYIALKNYELYNKDGSIGIYRFNEPNPKASVLRDRYRLVDFGFIDDLETPKEKRVKCQDTRCGYEKSVAVKQDGSIGCGGYVWCPKCGSAMRETLKTSKELESDAKKHDVVNHPKHYTQGKVECIDAIESATINKRGIEAVCTANIIKYLWRYESKNGIEDVKKAKWYLDRLLEKLRELDKKD